MTETDLIAQLAEAQRSGAPTADASHYASLDRAAAYRVQVGVLKATGQRVGMLKTAAHPDGIGVAAPIPGENVGRSGAMRLPHGQLTGVEVEVGVVLRHDLSGPADVATVRSAIDHFFLGVEVCGTRFVDRTLAGPNGGLADNMSSYAYVIGPRRTAEDRVDGLDIRVTVGGNEIYRAPARHGFGSVLASLVAYAANQHPSYPLKAGTTVTTGSMCGLVAVPAPGHVVASLGPESVEFDIV